ncbi:MAG TPA: STAS domain-containing protein [Candidatus Kapabacteria bacterium]|nr:STAS domain-containing protein [Candidatus Kapabacteria bacterium]
MALEINIQKNSDATTIKLKGSLDTSTAPELERQLTGIVDDSVRDLVFDLAELKFISSAGLRIFANARKIAKANGGQASFINMQSQIREVFDIIKALPGVAVFQSTAELDHYLAVRQQTHSSGSQR